MRIISGSHRGRQIFPDKSFSARPTTDFAKENLFNVLTNYMDLEDISALDLFSGTGSISYEFASRGAREIVSIEQNYKHYMFIRRTAKELGFKHIKIYKTDNVLKNAPHTHKVLTADEWTHTYPRSKAAYPLPWVAENKFWPQVGRVDDGYGDRNLMCTCDPLYDYVNDEN